MRANPKPNNRLTVFFNAHYTLAHTQPDRISNHNQIKPRSQIPKTQPPIAFPTLTKSNPDRPSPNLKII
ncbi:MAG: hypothetical protein LH649_07720 [Pseudanabaena sp. CAN_BIN31]|nr:hypothetical protein [Pseudanabaena sp. CAN_BIN31]